MNKAIAEIQKRITHFEDKKEFGIVNGLEMALDIIKEYFPEKQYDRKTT